LENSIRVRCVEEFELWGEGKTKLLAEVEKKEYDAQLYIETEEYFAKDSKGREFFVGEINNDGKLVLGQDFKLIE
jgi:hypothetical protein